MSHGGGGVGDFGLLIIVIVVIFFIWLATGGQNHEAATKGPFIKPLIDADAPGQIYGPKN